MSPHCCNSRRKSPENPQSSFKPLIAVAARHSAHVPIQGNKMSNLTFFIVLAGISFFPGPAPAAEREPLAALCARRDLRELKEAQQEMTVRDVAAATGINESTLR